MSIQMKPSVTEFYVNETLYEEYCQIINKLTSTVVYNFLSKGLGSPKTYGGETNDAF